MNLPITLPEISGRLFQSLKEVLTVARLSDVTVTVLDEAKLFMSTPLSHQAKIWHWPSSKPVSEN